MSVRAVESEQAFIVIELRLVVYVHTLAEVLSKLDGLVYTCVCQLASELKDEERFGHAILLESGGFVSDLSDFERFNLNLSRETFEAVFFEDVLELHKFLQFGLFVLHFLLGSGSVGLKHGGNLLNGDEEHLLELARGLELDRLGLVVKELKEVHVLGLELHFLLWCTVTVPEYRDNRS